MLALVTVTAIVLVIVIVILVRKLHRAKGKVVLDHLYRCLHSSPHAQAIQVLAWSSPDSQKNIMICKAHYV